MSALSNSWCLNLQEAYRQFYRRVRKYCLSSLLSLQIWSRRVPSLNPDSTEDPSCIGRVARLIIRGDPNVLPSVWCGSFESGVPAQVSSSSSDRSSDLRVPSKITLLQLQNGTLI
ncbi:hypothetical protein AVEN_49285-1 [Araneus ventricosus]|uniref:Uncharacterized protein n=1 Tax=Araneus ventricosus TaxID=182803 RepID=A0A4Y2HGU8_ARAVE|nr:hypothetical protein AVEN_2222-1 [Araneus ventricosus]GBM64203.1 hypothetical protein AVEN_49285-1 [Araneus ventricosus]